MANERPNRIDDRDKIGDKLDFSSREAYNVLRSSFEFVCVPTQIGDGKVIGITSPSPQDGKSITSINLCYSMAKKGASVLLIDGDLRRPVLSKILDLPQKPGLANYLVDGNARIINQNVLIKGLDVITSGSIPPNPSELISSRAMQNTLSQLREKYDYIVIDLPPVNSVADAFAISGYLDGIALVVRHGQSRKSDIADACRQLEFANAKILGFIYNGYYEGSSYYYRNGYNKYYYKYRSKYYKRGKYDSYGYYYGYGYDSYTSDKNDETSK